MFSGNKHCTCKTHNKVRIKNPHYPFFSSLLVALLPKCPFCVMAYTSAITVCSAKTITPVYSPAWTSYIPVSLAVLTLGIVVWNYKGGKTIASCLLMLTGILLIMRSELFSGQLASYYGGCSLLFLGVWVNGNLSYFVKLFTSRTGRESMQHG
jgi:hypothetical protein